MSGKSGAAWPMIMVNSGQDENCLGADSLNTLT